MILLYKSINLIIFYFILLKNIHVLNFIKNNRGVKYHNKKKVKTVWNKVVFRRVDSGGRLF
jgi:hypothetical protein